MPKFSVIIPVYNAEKYLKQCLDSLLEQQYDDFELILVNDCSTDGSMAVCQEYSMRYSNVRLINQENNMGVSAARNRGIDVARGDYILFVDSDDHVTNDYFETVACLVNEYPEDELLSFGNFDYLVQTDGTVRTRASSMNCNINSDEEDSWRSLCLKSFFACPWNKVFWRAILMEYRLRFDTSCVCYEDYIFNIEYCKHIKTFHVIDKPLYFYRQILTVNHVSKRKWGKRFEISEKVSRATNEFIVSKGAENSLIAVRRYTYKAFLVEVEVSYQKQETFDEDVMTLLHNDAFNESVDAIVPAGKLLTLYKLARMLHCDFVSRKLLIKQIG